MLAIYGLGSRPTELNWEVGSPPEEIPSSLDPAKTRRLPGSEPAGWPTRQSERASDLASRLHGRASERGAALLGLSWQTLGGSSLELASDSSPNYVV